jgi:hypothetical protein
VTVNGLIQKGNNTVKPVKFDTNSSDYMNVKLNVKEKVVRIQFCYWERVMQDDVQAD